MVEIIFGLFGGFCLFAGVIALTAFIGWKLDENPLVGGLVGMFIACIMTIFLPLESLIQCGFLSGILATGVAFIAMLITSAIFSKSEMIWPIWVVIIITMIAGLIGFNYMFLCDTGRDPYSLNIVPIEAPVEVVETRIDIIGGADAVRISGSLRGGRYVYGQVEEYGFYKLYVPEVRDEETIVNSLLIPEEETIVVLQDEDEEEYLLKVEEKFYKEDRNMDPYELIYDRTETYYKLYVNEKTFSGLQIVGN